MKTLRRVLPLGLVFGFSFASSSASALLQATLEPVVGYEQVQMLLPTTHKTTRLVYGARVTAGFSWLAGEGEYIHAQSDEQFSATAQDLNDTTDRARVGLRASTHLLGIVSFFLRGGAQAQRSNQVLTTSGVAVTTLNPIVYYPYGGAGLRLNLTRHIGISGDVTATFRSLPDMSQNDYMATGSLVIAFP